MNEISQPSVGLFQMDGGSIPLEDVEVQGNIIGRGAKIKILQRFRNVEDNPMEAVYKFPLPEGAAICGFKAVVDDRVIEGQIEERDKAFDLYDKALSDGHGAQLLDEERPNIFTLSVGNVRPKSTVVIEIDYVILLDTYESEVRFHLPMTISPRYTPENQPDQNGIPATDIVNPPIALSVPYGMKINVTIHDIRGISSIGSASHSINTEFAANDAIVSFTSGRAAMDRDFILTIVYKQEFVNRGFVLDTSDGCFIQLDFMPDENSSIADADGKLMEREIIFVLDCSGSMAGESIDEAKTALEIMIRALNPGALFNIYRFGNSYEHLFHRSKAYNKKEMQAALTYIFNTDASLGGTEILAPLKDIYRNKLKANQHRDIVVITDGEVSNENEVFDLTKTNAYQTTLHTVGIGSGPNEFLIKGLARSSCGASELIYPNERIEPKILRVFKKVINGNIRNIRVDWGTDVEQVPTKLNSFIGQGMCAFARVTGGIAKQKSLKVSGEVRSGLRTWDIALVPVNKEDTPIPILWAREKIRDIEEGYVHGSRQRERTNKKSIKAIIDISKKYGIVSSETSFIGIERRSESEKLTAAITLRKVPVMPTKGWGVTFYRKEENLCLRALSTHMFRREPISPNVCYRLVSPRESDDDADSNTRVMSCEKPPNPYEEDSLMDTPAYLRSHSVLTGRDVLLDILSLQQAEGGFYIDSSAENFIKISYADFQAITDKIDIKKGGDKTKILMTIIILLILELRYWARRDEWEGVVGKSRRWLQTEIEETIPTIDKQPLEEWMRYFFKGKPEIGEQDWL